MEIAIITTKTLLPRPLNWYSAAQHSRVIFTVSAEYLKIETKHLESFGNCCAVKILDFCHKRRIRGWVVPFLDYRACLKAVDLPRSWLSNNKVTWEEVKGRRWGVDEGHDEATWKGRWNTQVHSWKKIPISSTDTLQIGSRMVVAQYSICGWCNLTLWRFQYGNEHTAV